MKDIKKHPLAVYDGKYLYYRKDMVIESCKEAGKALAEDFERAYIRHNITEPSKEGKDVDVRLEQSICKLNVKNIKHTCKHLAEYFDCASMPPKKGEDAESRV